MLLVQPDASRTGDPLENQRGLALATVRSVAEDPHEALLEIGVIIELQALDDRRQSLVWRIRQGIAMTVVVGQPVVDNRLRHRLTSTTAHGARLPVDAYRKIDRSGYGLATMVAIADSSLPQTRKRKRRREKGEAPAGASRNWL
jgi:hypothetical protein